MDFQTWLARAVTELENSDSPKRDAQIILGFVTGKSRTFILAFAETVLDDSQLSQLAALLSRRVKGEPVAYLVGEREFWSLPLRVSPATLIPRPDTECLVEQALAYLPSHPCNILDLGTGTGAIALALASERPDCQIIALDVVPEAVELARSNGLQLGITNVTVQQSHWFSALDNDQRFNLIASNPPYIDSADKHLSLGDVRFEPKSALVADHHGLADIEILVGHSQGFLEPGGWLILEHGWQQGAQVRQLFREAGYHHVSTGKDYGGNERFTSGQFIP
ncbi:peptide chain release factor N(5)-glutamine methyltransferase [Citrobacter sp. JGM124]|uniref:peptide chain release factor N(5)-glutamine methyltransferase n=1 Tax=Citrobacter sp. JGM124 TaxID=2799789 RepID=UPI001BAC00E5|nr:peptide chain release factor N(5)-glutamine methyltransferase [Citrobacter sp. JGM124]MBS0847182.1 peptide chain release factor N(5)-glutamine methyltransferase [Citrobacter sp. JGM124]